MLIRGYVKPDSPTAHGQARVLLVGTAAAVLPITVLAIVPAALGLSPPVQPQVAALSTVALPLSLAYVVLRYRFLGIEVVVGRALVYGLMTALLAGCYALGLAGLAVARRNGLDENVLVTVIFFAAVTATFVPIRDFLRTRIDYLIYRDRYNYATTLRELGDQLASIRPLDEALSVVAEALTSAMNLEGVAVLLCRGDGTYDIQAASGRYAAGAGPKLEDWAARIDADPPRAAGTATWIPLVARGERCGFLCLGAKRVPSEFSPGDLDLLHTLASQAAVAVANVLLVERLKAKVEELSLLRDRLLHAQEEERKRVARDLHDGALHTVLGLARQADVAAYHSAIGNHHPELCDQLRNLAELGQGAADELRSICSDLYPAELEHMGLVPALRQLAGDASRDESVIVRVQNNALPDDYRLPASVEETLYRISREALDNVLRHAGATEVRIQLSLDRSQLVLSVCDDGRGFPPGVSAGQLLQSGHLGLASTRERIERLHGEFTLSTFPGRGTEISAQLPIEMLDCDSPLANGATEAQGANPTR